MFSLNPCIIIFTLTISWGGIEILSELVRNTKTGNPLSGDVYLFCGKKTGHDQTVALAGRRIYFYIRSV